MNASTSSNGVRSQAMYMFISALLFGYFGFFNDWSHQYTTDDPPKLLIMVVILKWTLRGGTIAFALAGVLAAGGSVVGPLLNCLAGLITAVLFLAVAYWDWSNPQYISGVPEFILVLFALWNGFGSWMGLMELRGIISPRSGSSLP